MERKRRVLLIAAGLLAITALVLAFGISVLYLDPKYPIKVDGNLSPKDVAEIKAAVARFRRHEIMPDFSWSSVRGLPAAIERYRKYHISQIVSDVRTQTALVMLESSGRKAVELQDAAPAESILMFIGKHPDGWHFPNNKASQK